jgi:hypothetical protein
VIDETIDIDPVYAEEFTYHRPARRYHYVAYGGVLVRRGQFS